MQLVAASLRQRLLDAEEEFLSVQDAAAMEDFGKKWDILCHDFEKAMEASLVDDPLEELARSIFHRVAVLGDSLIHLEDEANTIQVSAMTAIEDLLAQMSIQDIVEPSSPKSSVADYTSAAFGTAPSPRSPRSPKNKTSSPSLLQYISRPYSWMLVNLHNPYPPASLKTSMASEAGVSLRTMDDWFKSVRRHIGWVSLVKRHFKGSRSLAIAAAERVFCRDSDDANIPSEIASDFLAMQSKLADLYSEQSAHKRSSSSASRARSTASFCSPSPGPTQSSTARNSPASISTELFEPLQSSPSTRPPSLVFTSSDSEDDDRSSLFARDSLCVSRLEEVDCRALKRLRISDEQADSLTFCSDASQPIVAQDAPLSSSVAEPDWWSTYVQDIPAFAPTKVHIPAPVISSKKRRRAGEDIVPPAKRTRNDRRAPGGKNPKAVSNPLPTRHNDQVFDYENLFKNDGSSLSFDLRFYPLLDLSSSAQGEPGRASIENDGATRTSDIANVEGDSAPPILGALSSTALSLTPLPTDVGVSDTTPEALQEMLDSFLVTLTSGALPADGEDTFSPLQFSPVEFEPAPSRSTDLTLEQRREFDLFLSSTESACLQANTRASFPQLDKDFGKDIFGPAILSVPDPPLLPRFLALDSCVSFDLDT